MKEKEPPQKRDRENLEKLTHQELVEMVLTCQELISKQNEVIERLKSYLGKDSTTSSKPPSSDLPKRPEKAKEEKTTQGRRPDGQKGHPGKTRKGFDRVDRSEFLPATKCNSCGSENLEKVGVTEHSQVVAQLVERPIEVVEYRQQCTHCKDCGQKVVAPLPPDVVPGQDLGVSLQAMLGWMSHYGHLSYGKQQEWLREIGRIEVGVGTLQSTTRRLSEAVKGSIERLQEWVKKQPQVHVDESPWLVKGLKEWMWIISGEGFALFHAGDTRSRSELESLLGQSFTGFLNDRFG
ncbi:MAG: IS66 family transposase [Prochlorotrichaceae cyanobacterium]|jgi:transposase